MPTFGEVWREMIELDRLQRSPATIIDYEDRAKRLILPTLGRRLIGDITQADVEKVVGTTRGNRNRAYVIALSGKRFISPATRGVTCPRRTATLRLV